MQPESRSLKYRIPWLMGALRAVLGPVMMVAELAGWPGLTLAWMVFTALLSDIFDGVLARRWKCDTAAVRLFDSMADIIFYLCCAAALWFSQPQLMRTFVVPIAIILSLEALKLLFDFVKFGKPTSYHSYLAKTWGLVLAITVIMSFVMQMSLALRIAWWVSVTLGTLYCLEGLAMSLIMPEWRHDLKTLWRAWKVRRQILTERNSERFAQIVGTIIAMMLVFIGAAAHASSIPSVKFLGGSTAGIVTGTAGSMETGTDQITFQWNGGSIAIPYAQIQNFSYRQEAVPLGMLPIIAVLLVHPQPHRNIVSITWLDPAGQKEVAVFQVPKEARDVLPTVLQERSGVCADQYQLPCRTTNNVRTSHRSAQVPIPLIP